MNIYLNNSPFAPIFVRFGAKRSAFWCKMQGKMVLNAVQNGAKCKPKKHKYLLQLHKQNLL
jgi:hypothetical protein